MGHLEYLRAARTKLDFFSLFIHASSLQLFAAAGWLGEEGNKAEQSWRLPRLLFWQYERWLNL